MNNEDRRTLDVSGGTGMPLETLNWHGTALKQEPPIPIEFRKSGEWVMRITAARRIEVNEGITVTEAAQHVLDALQTLLGHPPQRKPLTDEDIEQAQRTVWRSLPSDFDYTTSSWIEIGIRYAEAAHGIGEKP